MIKCNLYVFIRQSLCDYGVCVETFTSWDFIRLFLICSLTPFCLHMYSHMSSILIITQMTILSYNHREYFQNLPLLLLSIFQKGDVIVYTGTTFKHETLDGFIYGKNRRTNQEGFVPKYKIVEIYKRVHLHWKEQTQRSKLCTDIQFITQIYAIEQFQMFMWQLKNVLIVVINNSYIQISGFLVLILMLFKQTIYLALETVTISKHE